MAVAMAVDHCLQTMRLHRIEIAIRPENTASLRVVEKLGFVRIGHRAALPAHQRCVARPRAVRGHGRGAAGGHGRPAPRHASALRAHRASLRPADTTSHNILRRHTGHAPAAATPRLYGRSRGSDRSDVRSRRGGMGDVSGSDGAAPSRPGRPEPLDRAVLVDDAGALASRADDDRVVRPSAAAAIRPCTDEHVDFRRARTTDPRAR